MHKKHLFVLVLLVVMMMTGNLMAQMGASLGTSTTETTSDDDVWVNLIQWTTAEGGNDHWYAVIPQSIYWDDAMRLTSTLTRNDSTPYLATVASAEENQFILDRVIADLENSSVLDMYWLGGEDIGGAWNWISDEPWGYENWGMYEPNNVGIETVMGIWGPTTTDPRRVSGTWNNTLPNAIVNPYALYWSVIEWGGDIVIEPNTDSVINLIQWPVSEGGNDHWYAILPQQLFWDDAVLLSPTLYNGIQTGYLATIGSADENQFILNQVIKDTEYPGVTDQYWLGGEDVGGQWNWLTGEPWSYVNWQTGEPNNIGIETALSINGPSANGSWNNSLPNNDINSLHQFWSIVEWGEITVPIEDTMVNLIQWAVADGGNDHWYAVIPHAMYWDDAKAMIETIEHDGTSAYLATIADASENQFIFEHVLDNLRNNSILDHYWLGGEEVDGQWGWTTGEPWTFENWGPGEPNNIGIETVLGFWGPTTTDPRRTPGTWNNSLANAIVNPFARYWSIIEWGDLNINSGTSILYGSVSAEAGGLFGVPVDLFDATMTVVGTTVTDEAGHFQFDALTYGHYTVSIATPLGFLAFEELIDIDIDSPMHEINFLLSQIEITADPRTRGYWSHQISKAMDNKPQDYDLDDFAEFAGLVNIHFNQNQINPIDIYSVPNPESLQDSMIVLRDLLHMRGDEIDTPQTQLLAKAQLMSLLLNVVSGKISQTHQITTDGQTISQAMTYCDMLVTDEIEPPDDGGPGSGSADFAYLRASYILVKCNHSLDLPVRMIPEDIFDIAYRFSGDELPGSYALDQNYPNPFNPTTEIGFTLPAASHVTLEIFNLLGQSVATLVDSRLEAGTHTITWDSRNADGGTLASGLYLYRIRMDDFTETKKMLLVK